MKSYLKTSDHFLSKESFELLYDEEMDMLVTHPIPNDITKYYESKDYISHSDGEGSFFEKTYQWVKRINLYNKISLVKKYAGSSRTLLDVGAGTGNFLIGARRKGWKVSGVEPNTDARRLASEKGIELQKNLNAINGEKFQIITLWHVLEHLPNLKESVQQLSELLEDDGTLIVAVPNFKSYDAQFYKSYWAAYDVPRHLWHFSRKAIENLFSYNYMELIKVKPMWFDSFYVSLLSEQYKKGKKNWFKAAWIGFWSNVKGIFSKEYSSHIYILQKAKRKA